jgi:mono/diheme cytochrome c family protein
MFLNVGSSSKHSFGPFFSLGSSFLLAVLLLMTACSGDEGPPPITEQNFNPDSIASFVEPDFPFITTSVDARELGAGFPNDNITPRCVAIKLGPEAYTCFDTDMLRWSVAWTGDFLPMVTMGQISYRDFHNKSNEIPLIAGNSEIATGLYPGWTGADPQFEDPRPPSPNPKAPSWGPIPQDIGRWNGLYLDDDQVVLNYTMHDTQILETPGSVTVEDQTAFTRTFRIDDLKKSLSLVAAEVSNGTRSEVQGNKAYIYQGAEEDSVTAVAVLTESSGAEVQLTDNRYATVQLADSQSQYQFSVILWKGVTENIATFDQLVEQARDSTEFPDYQEGGPAQWAESVRTKGQLAPDTSAYVVDRLTLPIPNRWKRNVRVVDVAFFEDNRAAAVTFEGDVWLIEGINDKLQELTWHRFASGLYEPQSIEIVDGTIYTYGKGGITRFHDFNDDQSADYYENFSNLMEQSIETREWASGMVAAPDGSFYVSKFGALDMGPETSSPKSIMGFRAGSQYGGTITKIASDGRSIEYYATGFRGPYVGINPETGVLSSSDQQGHSMPSTPVNLVDKGDYYGVPATAYRDSLPETSPPLTWIPHSVDRSGAGQVWITSDKMGPLSGNMMHLSYGKPGIFKVLMDSTSDAVQGAVSFIDANYPAPTMKGDVSPKDGQLYVGGFSLWGSDSEVISSLIRLRYTGKQSLKPRDFKVRKRGVILRFGTELNEEVATNPANFQVKRWNYKRSREYGSGHYKLDGSPGEETMPVFSAHLSEDKKSVFLAIPDVQEIQQMVVGYNLETSDSTALSDKLWFSVNDVEEADLMAQGFPDINVDALLTGSQNVADAEEVEKPITAERGKKLFQQTGCIACHAVKESSDEGNVGPALHGLFGTTQKLKDGTSVEVDKAYLEESILKPGAKVVADYEGEMPSFLGILSTDEVASIAEYIKSLSDE